MTPEEIRKLKQEYCTAHDDIQAYALLEIAAQLAELNAALTNGQTDLLHAAKVMASAYADPCEFYDVNLLRKAIAKAERRSA